MQLLLRIGAWIVLGWLGEVGLGLFIFVMPILSAVLIAQRGGAAFLERWSATYTRLLGFGGGVIGYLAFATDRIPEWDTEGAVRLQVDVAGEPTVGSALLHISLVIPHVTVLWLLGFISGILTVVAFITVLFAESVPDWLRAFQVRYVACHMRVAAYYFSLVPGYPPFSFDAPDPERPAAA